MNPSEEASEAGKTLLESTSVQREILKESAETGEESGRTLCGDTEIGPSNRGFKQVQLAQCNLGQTAVMHGGGGHDLRSPEHSLVDMAIVLWERPAASLVAGSEQSDLFLAPDEESLTDAQRAFSEALGYDVNGAREVAELLDSGSVDAVEATGARREVRKRLADLFMVVDTPHEIEPVVDVEPAQTKTTAQAASVGSAIDDIAGTFWSGLMKVWAVLSNTFTFDPSDANVNVLTILASEIAGAAALFFFLKVLGSSPKQMVA